MVPVGPQATAPLLDSTRCLRSASDSGDRSIGLGRSLDGNSGKSLDHLVELETPIEAVFEGSEIAFGVLRVA
jgi:hypothetical protein